MLTTSVDDDWGEGEALPAPKYICTAIVTKDYIPETNDHLTLILDDLVYVFSKNVKGKPGFWEGETKGVYGTHLRWYSSHSTGIFPASHVKEIKE